MIEVEIKARIANIQEAKEKIQKSSAQFMRKEEQLDCIFGHPKMLDEDDMVVEGGYSARLRQVDSKTKLTFKEVLRGKGGIEIESNIGSVEIGRSFLNSLGFKEAFNLHKIRDIFNLKDVEISIDEVDLLGNFIEVEKIVDAPEKIEAARKECQEVLDSLGIKYKIVTKKYGDLMQEIINQNKK